MMPALNLPIVAQISSERLLNCVAGGILIALLRESEAPRAESPQ